MALASAALAACAARTGIAESDFVARPDGAPYGEVLVVGLDGHPELREQVERALARELDARGARAVVSSSFLAFATRPPSPDELRALVEREGADGILVARVAPRGTEYRQVPVADPFYGTPVGFYDWYWGLWPAPYPPTYVETVPVAALEVRLFDARGEARLVYRATSEEFRLNEARSALESVGVAVADGLAGAGLLPGAAPVSRGPGAAP